MKAKLSESMQLNEQEFERFLRQIKSYEEQLNVIELATAEEEKLKDSRPNWLLVLWTGIAGIQYHVDTSQPAGRKLMKSLKPGVELNLVREPDNKYDRWAIAIYTAKKEMIGYVTRFKNESIARLMDNGYKFHAIIESEMQTNYEVPYEQWAITENFDIPFSIWMEI